MGATSKYLFRGLVAMLIYSICDGYIKYWFKGVIDGVSIIIGKNNRRKVLGDKTMRIIKNIYSQRPSMLYMLRKRLFRGGVSGRNLD